MTVYDLSREQLRKLKQRHLMEQGPPSHWESWQTLIALSLMKRYRKPTRVRIL